MFEESVSAFLGQLTAIFVAGGLGSAIFNGVLAWWQERRKRVDQVQYLAIRLAFLFEEYGLTARKCVSENELKLSSGGHAGRQITQIPEAPILPDGDGYKYLDRQLLHDVLEFAQERELMSQAAYEYYDLANLDDDEMSEELALKTARLGLQGFDLAERLRNKYKLAGRDFGDENWSPRNYLQKHVADHQQRKDDAVVQAVDIEE